MDAINQPDLENTEPEADSTHTGEPEPEQVMEPEAAQVVETAQDAPKPKKSRRWLAPVLVVVLILAGVGGFFGYRFYVQDTEAKLVVQANQALHDGFYAAAISAATTAIETSPESWRQHTLEAQAVRGMAQFKLDQPDAALADLDIAIAAGGVGDAGPSLTALYAARAWIYLGKGSSDKALPDLDAALKGKPDAALYAERAKIYVAKDRIDDALADIDASLELDNQQSDLMIIKATILLAEGDREGSMSVANAAQALSDTYALPLAYDAEAQYLARKYDEAAETAKKSTGYPDAPAFAYRIHGAAALWQFKIAQARTALDQAIKLDPQDADALALRAYLNYEDGDFAAFEADALKAAEIDPEGAAGLYATAQWAAHQRRFADARKAIDQAIALSAERPEFYALRAAIYTRTEELPLFTVDLDKALELAPGFRLALPAQARYEMWLGHFSTGMQTGETLSADYPEWEAGYLLVAEYHYLTFDFAKAEEILTQATRKQENSFTNAVLQGSVYLAQRKLDQARTAFESAIAMNPYTVEGFVGLAAVERKLGNYTEALAHIDKALVIDPKSVSAFLMRYEVYSADGDGSRARQATNEAKAVDPDSLALNIVFVMDSLKRNDLSNATRKASELLTKYPDRPDLYVVRAMCNIGNKRSKDAQKDLDAAFLLLARNPNAYAVNALLNLLEGEKDAAIKNIENALEITPEDASLYAMLGEIKYLKQDYTEAEADLTRALEMDPAQKSPHYIRSRVRLAVKNYTGAAEDLKAYIDSSETQYSSMAGKLDNALKILPADFDLHIYEDRGFIIALPKDAQYKFIEPEGTDDTLRVEISGKLNDSDYLMWIYLIEDSETASAMAIALDYMPFLRNKYGLRFEAPASFNTYTEQGARSTFTRSSAKGTYYFFQTSNDLSIIEAIGPAAAFPPMQDMFDNIAKSFMRLH